MHRIHTHESVAVRALRNGDTETIGGWLRDTLPTVVPEQLPAPVVRHPLEFICLPLYRYGKVGLCLHVWPDTPDTPDTDEPSSPIVHAHSWDLWSYVVCGTALNQIMAVRDETETPEHGLYTVTSAGGVDEVRATGRLVTCLPGKQQEVHAGQIYELSSGLFHRSGHRGLTVTLVLGEQREGLDNLVLGPLDGYPWHDSPRESCSPDEARVLLKLIAMHC